MLRVIKDIASTSERRVSTCNAGWPGRFPGRVRKEGK
jgi:hypothetical protein